MSLSRQEFNHGPLATIVWVETRTTRTRRSIRRPLSNGFAKRLASCSVGSLGGRAHGIRWSWQQRLVFAIGPIDPEPTAGEQTQTLRAIAAKHGHTVIDTGIIDVMGKRHATVTCRVPGAGILKNYSLIFDGIEYLATARGDIRLCDSIVTTFRTA